MKQTNAKVYSSIRAALLENANAAGEIGAALLWQKTGIKGEFFNVAIDQDVFKAALRQLAEDKEINVNGQVIRFTTAGRKAAEGEKAGPDASAGKRQTAAQGKKTTGGGKGKDAGPKSGGKADAGGKASGGKADAPKAPKLPTIDEMSAEDILARITAPEKFTAELVERALWRLRSFARKQGYLPKSDKSED